MQVLTIFWFSEHCFKRFFFFFFVITVAFHLGLGVRNSIWNLCVSVPRHTFLKRHHVPSPYRKQSHRNIPLLYFYIFFFTFLFLSFISATGDRQEETEVMETDVSREECLPSEATSSKSDSDLFVMSCNNYKQNCFILFLGSQHFDSCAFN